MTTADPQAENPPERISRVYKYGTGWDVPEGAEYLATVVEEGRGGRFVWHYFLVRVS